MEIADKNLSEFLITEDKTILQTMQILDKSGRRILFVHKDGELLATITDGDIRRWILKGGSLSESVKFAANYQPMYLEESKIHLASSIMREKATVAVPVVDENRKIKKICFMNELYGKVDKFEEHIPVIIMAGGIGGRLSPYTNILPKPLIPIGELPIVEHIINQFKRYGCDDFRMIVNYKRNMIKAYFSDIEKDYTMQFITEEKALGTGGGISLLKGKIDSTFILTNCDILIEEDLSIAYKHHKESGNLITMVCSLKNFVIPYGIVNIGKCGNIESIQEKPSMAFYTNTGCYFVEPEVVEELEYNEPIDFTMIVSRYVARGEKVGVYPIGENAWLDMGQIDELEKMKEKLGC